MAIDLLTKGVGEGGLGGIACYYSLLICCKPQGFLFFLKNAQKQANRVHLVVFNQGGNY